MGSTQYWQEMRTRLARNAQRRRQRRERQQRVAIDSEMNDNTNNSSGEASLVSRIKTIALTDDNNDWWWSPDGDGAFDEEQLAAAISILLDEQPKPDGSFSWSQPSEETDNLGSVGDSSKQEELDQKAQAIDARTPEKKSVMERLETIVEEEDEAVEEEDEAVSAIDVTVPRSNRTTKKNDDAEAVFAMDVAGITSNCSNTRGNDFSPMRDGPSSASLFAAAAVLQEAPFPTLPKARPFRSASGDKEKLDRLEMQVLQTKHPQDQQQQQPSSLEDFVAERSLNETDSSLNALSEWWPLSWDLLTHHKPLSGQTDDGTALLLDATVELFREGLHDLRNSLSPPGKAASMASSPSNSAQRHLRQDVPILNSPIRLNKGCSNLVKAILIDPRCIKLCRDLPCLERDKASYFLVDMELVKALKDYSHVGTYVSLAHRMLLVMYAIHKLLESFELSEEERQEQIRSIQFLLDSIGQTVTANFNELVRPVPTKGPHRASYPTTTNGGQAHSSPKDEATIDLTITLAHWNVFLAKSYAFIREWKQAYEFLVGAVREGNILFAEYLLLIVHLQINEFSPTLELYDKWRRYIHKAHKDDYYMTEAYSWISYIIVQSRGQLGSMEKAWYWLELSDKAHEKRNVLYSTWSKRSGPVNPFAITWITHATERKETLDQLRARFTKPQTTQPVSPVNSKHDISTHESMPPFTSPMTRSQYQQEPACLNSADNVLYSNAPNPASQHVQHSSKTKDETSDVFSSASLPGQHFAIPEQAQNYDDGRYYLSKGVSSNDKPSFSPLPRQSPPGMQSAPAGMNKWGYSQQTMAPPGNNYYGDAGSRTPLSTHWTAPGAGLIVAHLFESRGTIPPAPSLGPTIPNVSILPSTLMYPPKPGHTLPVMPPSEIAKLSPIKQLAHSPIQRRSSNTSKHQMKSQSQQKKCNEAQTLAAGSSATNSSMPTLRSSPRTRSMTKRASA